MRVLRFCPACGGKLPQAAVVKFCAHCGENLAQFTAPENAPPKSPADLPVAAVAFAEYEVKTYADVVRFCDQFIIDQQGQGLDQAEIQRRAAVLFAKLKAQLPVLSKPVIAKKMIPAALPPDGQAEDHYSVVLKSCGDKARLTTRLSEVLRRGLTATRMAVDMVPCIIVYKSKLQDIQAAVAIFEDEQLHYTVIQGDFAATTTVETMISGFSRLDGRLQNLFANTPPVLWLGEQIQLVTEGKWEDEPGALVATDKAVYFFRRTMDGRYAEWRVTPYHRLDEVFSADQAGALAMIFQEDGREERMFIADPELLAQMYDVVGQAVMAGKDR
ncbi:MAG: zinc ribbon domain-containing protein [Negativicutes bacterium]|nr:zinc ribbon domain-containing protein [Negativicutes bacterium]